MENWKINNSIHKELVTWNDKIVTRFPPEPGGALHIGHAKAIFINYIIAKKYNGKCILRFDDTNPKNASIESENMISEDINKLGITFDKTTRTSDYFDQIIAFGDYLIDNGLAYVDNTDKQNITMERDMNLENQNRNNDVETNKQLWNSIKNGMVKDSVVRIKFNMKNKNACMKDPIIFRPSEAKHHIAQHMNVYPTYDFACPIVDSLEGVTHVFRSTEFSDRDEQYTEILKYLKLNIPILSAYGKVSIENTVMSKRKIRKLIDDNVLEGWNDPRLMTISGTINRGLNINALTNYIAHLGFSKNIVNMTPDMLWNINKKHIDKESSRFVAIDAKNSVIVDIIDYIESEPKTIPKFVRNPLLGNRNVYYSPKIIMDKTDYDNLVFGEEVTLVNWGNAIVVENGLKLYLEGDFKKTDKKLLWLPSRDDIVNTQLKIIKYGSVIEKLDGTTTKIIKNGSVREKPNKIIEIKDNIELDLIADPDMMLLKEGDYVQLLKMDYYICKSINSNKLVLYDVPT